MIKIRLSILFIFVTGILLANDTLTWTDCINYALENNLEIQMNEYNREYQKLVYRNQINAFLPGASAGTSYGLTIGRSVDPNTNDYINEPYNSSSFSIGSSIDIFDGFTRVNRIKLEKLNLKIADKELEQMQNTISFTILENYISTLFYQELFSISAEKLETSKKELYRSQRLKELGKLAGTDVYEAEAKMVADSFQLIRATGLYETSLMQLKENMNFPSQEELTIAPIKVNQIDLAYSDFSKDTLLNSAINYLPEVQKVYYQLSTLQKQLAIQRGNFSPNIGASASWRSGYSETSTLQDGTIKPFKDQVNEKATQNFGISLSIPILNSWYKRNAISRTKIQIDRMNAEIERTKIQVEYEISQLIIDLNSLSTELEASSKYLKAQETVFKAAQKKRENGLISLVDLFSFSDNLAVAKNENSRLKMQLFLKLKYVNFYLEGTILN